MKRTTVVGRLAVFLSLGAFLAAAQPASAQTVERCTPGWEQAFGASAPYTPSSMAVFDDGTGPALYVSGAGGTLNLARWDGEAWSGVGVGPAGGPSDEAHALAVFDDGSGPALFAALDRGRLERWDGTSWSVIPGTMNRQPFAMAVFDDGTGPALFVGGWFTSIDGASMNHIAKWDGSSWTSVGGGTNGNVESLFVFDDGSGPALYVGGMFSTAGGVSASNIARWDGTTWSALGAGSPRPVYAMTAFDAGSGADLYIGGGGIVQGVTDSWVRRWDGAVWSTVGTFLGDGAFTASINALTVYDNGSGPALYVGGSRFSSVNGVEVNALARWDGAAWSGVGERSAYAGCSQLLAADLGGGDLLYAGGSNLPASSGVRCGLASWDGSTWSSLNTGLNGYVNCAAVFDDGSGEALFVSGAFFAAGPSQPGRVAKWRDGVWTAYEIGPPSLNDRFFAMGVGNVGDADALYMGGAFTSINGMPAGHVVKFDGADWFVLGSGVNGDVYAVQEFDDGSGPAMYFGGEFTEAGGASANNIARWDGTTWSALGAGTNYRVRALTVFDDGSGPALYAGGSFTEAGGAPASHVARWDGSSWTPVDTGLLYNVNDFAVFDDGSGPALHIAGGTRSGVAKWDGATWSALGGGLDGTVYTIASFDDGSGPKLYAGGDISRAEGTQVNRIVRWDGSAWRFLVRNTGPGRIGDAVNDLVEFGSDLVIAGDFFSSPASDSFLALWKGCRIETCALDLNGSGVVDFGDLNVILSNYGDAVTPGTSGDVNEDGVVDFGDLNVILSNYGESC